MDVDMQELHAAIVADKITIEVLETVWAGMVIFRVIGTDGEGFEVLKPINRYIEGHNINYIKQPA